MILTKSKDENLWSFSFLTLNNVHLAFLSLSVHDMMLRRRVVCGRKMSIIHYFGIWLSAGVHSPMKVFFSTIPP